MRELTVFFQLWHSVLEEWKERGSRSHLFVQNTGVELLNINYAPGTFPGTRTVHEKLVRIPDSPG